MKAGKTEAESCFDPYVKSIMKQELWTLLEQFLIVNVSWNCDGNFCECVGMWLVCRKAIKVLQVQANGIVGKTVSDRNQLRTYESHRLCW